ncbi:MAG: alpha/beta fold hydrolase [Caulobacteraceae bacterium]
MIFKRLTVFIMALGITVGPSYVLADVVDVPGGHLYYETCGAGPKAILLVHDGLIDSSGFDELWPILCKDFRVVRYDRRGYGKSPVTKAAYSQTEDLASVVGAAKIDHFNLVGFSAGGGVALDYALDHPQAVDHLVLVGAQIDGFVVSDQFAKRGQDAFSPILKRDINEGDIDAVAANWTKDPYLIMPGDDAAKAKASAIWKANPQNIRHLLNDPVKPAPSALPRMRELNIPTLILTGDHDIADVQAMAGAAQVLIPGSKRIVVNGSGHLLQLEQPHEAAKLISKFVRTSR